MSARQAAIVGAGLGGLVAALSLLQHGWRVSVYEQAPQLGEVGAGLSLSRSTLHVLQALDLFPQVRALASPVNGLPFLHYQTGALLSGVHDRTDGRLDPDADPASVSLQIHRADLHAVLVAALRARAPDSLRLGRRLEAFERAGERARLRFADGATEEADLAIGADGVRSVMRTRLWNAPPPRFTGQVAYRCLLDPADAAPYMGAGRAAVYVGPGSVFNRYTLRGGALVNCVSLVATDDWQGEGWSHPARTEEVLAAHEGWHPDVRGLLSLARAGSLIRWGLFDREPLPRWSDGPFTLLGDAAHPMLPFLGLGAAMAIEDGYVLGRALEPAGDLQAGLRRYEAARLPRTGEVALLSRRQGALLQDQDPDRFGARPSSHTNAALYGFNPVTAPL